MIELRGVVKRHSDEVCIGPVDLDIQAGGVTALVGPNGAGTVSYTHLRAHET